MAIAIGNIALRQLASVACDERADQGLDHRRARGRGRRGTVIGVTLATRNDVQRQSSKPPPFAARIRRPRRSRAAGARSAAGMAGRHGSAAADSRRALSPQRPRPARARPCACTLGPAGRRDPGVAGGGAGPAGFPVRGSSSQDLRHPNSPPGLPPFVPSFTRVTSPVESQLLRGAAYQQALRPVSAEREFAAAARAAPDDPEALTAAAVGLYDKDEPALAFSRLGPLARRFPHAQTVRFHLGLLLDLLRRHASCSSRAGPRPRARRTNPAWKEGRNAS